MSYTKRALESTDPSFQCSTKIEMTASDIMLSADFELLYEKILKEYDRLLWSEGAYQVNGVTFEDTDDAHVARMFAAERAVSGKAS